MENDVSTVAPAPVAAAMREHGMEAPRDGVVTARDVRVEFHAGTVKAATLTLAPGVRLGVAGDECWLTMRGSLPGALSAALPGRDVGEVIRHRWTDGAGLRVEAVEPGEDRTRIALARS